MKSAARAGGKPIGISNCQFSITFQAIGGFRVLKRLSYNVSYCLNLLVWIVITCCLQKEIARVNPFPTFCVLLTHKSRVLNSNGVWYSSFWMGGFVNPLKLVKLV